jgi:Concanavalin A-like lectin/glucanases superfamily
MRILKYKIIITGLSLLMALVALVAPGSKAEKTFPSAAKTPTQTPTPWPTATKCPTSRWLAEGNANDSGGLIPGNPGTLKNGAAFGTGAVGAAFSLDGLNDYVEVPINIAAMNNPGSLGSFTWEACVNPSSLANINPVVFSKEASVGNRAGLQINSNGSLCSYMNSGSCAATSAPGLVAPNTFTKVTLLYNGSTNNLVTYVNGLQVSTATVAVPYNNSAAFNIGWSPNAFGNTHFNGRIDEVIFSSCAKPPTPCGCGQAPTPSPSSTPIQDRPMR